MKWEIQRYETSWEKDWDCFIDNQALNSTFLHTRRFLKHNPLNQEEDYSFLFLKKGKIAACIPAVLIDTDGRRVWNSHMRSTYGGLLVSAGVGLEDVLEITQLLENELLKNEIHEAIIRNTFRIFNRDFCDEFDYALWKAGFVIKSRETEIGIALKDKSVKDIERKYDNGNKYNIKKALKTVDVRFSDDFCSFWILLEQNLLQKHNQKPVHNIEAIYNLKNLLKEGEIKLVAAFEQNVMIGGMILFDFMNEYLHAQYIASSHAHQQIRPVNAVIDFALKWACEKKYNYFNLGTPNEKNGSVINLGLSYFKESFGGRSCLRETMHKVYNYDKE